MTQDEMIQKLDERITRIEHDVWTKLSSIDEKITALAVSIAALPHCPKPGACIPLEDRVKRLEHTHDNMAKTVSDLIRWRAWLTGANVVISTLSLGILGLIGKYLLSKV